MNKSATDTSTAATQTRAQRLNALPPPPPDALCKALGIEDIAIEWLAGDGSDRCYYRLRAKSTADVSAGTTYVLMQLSGADAQALQKGGYDWLKIADILTRQGVAVPRPVVALPDYAALVIEDYGDRTLETDVFDLAGDFDAIFTRYQRCFSILTAFLAVPENPAEVWCTRQFDAERFAWELEFFMSNYGHPIAALTLTSDEQAAFKRETMLLSQTLASYSRYFVHRDFHSRNVMALNQRLAVIDFQDARIGPSAYDLVSLVFDSYVPFTREQRQLLLNAALDTFERDLGATVRSDVEAHWQPMLLQRQLKAIGSFGYLTLVKNRGNYLQYVKPALATIDDDQVFDERWPFLSRTLLARLKTALR